MDTRKAAHKTDGIYRQQPVCGIYEGSQGKNNNYPERRKTLTTGIRTDGEDINEEPISIRQVRRVVNPKGVWRSGGESAPFHVVLKILPNEEATEFEPLPSGGPWRAYVMRDSKRGDSGQDGCISLSGSENTDTGQITVTDKNGVTGTYQTIEGKNGPI